ncbi:3,4-dihydroxy-2-butanone-4-phosphate synthase [Victivallis vadensis]|jgi:3,4-dihydroxy-2-butanone-4-phosphate synthase|uniref:3,4-dihydroxy-2-butanone-4-phosphate synthase n=1 Tax=Victivallis vadensis TaxID=172901 RepID=UPI000D7AC267|nr:3,4-dihydroxy-2-butanone-4-phosphate synthase [Victivallis vadensis]PWM82316.1 MAG: 3,4-dihydroxy-2-butanone-4-phosphate synthase [Lentisphaerota bacterium]HJH04462.1 3,4-dihydroxy-2-butanone-4-phosphate synthase [Victivallis vadensis]
MFDPIEDVIAAIGRGELVIVTDDEGRENEGDLIGAGAFADAAMLNFMVTHARGLLCAPLSAEYAARLGLAEPAGKHDPRHTAFTQSVDAVEGTTTGVSAFDRARTVARLVDPASTLEDFYSPGHLFPLIARPGGVLERPGHTEASVDMAVLAGLPPVAVLCEILKDDGTMARVPDLELYAKKHHLKMGSVADLIAYRRRLNCVCA